MASLPPEPILPASDPASAPAALPGSLVAQWEALHRQAAGLALLARIAPEDAAALPFAGMVAEAGQWQRTLAAQGLEDIAAMLRPGLAALATLTARGQDTAAPALALWREFHAARAAVMAALQPTHAD
ncbi:MAG: hypothetical protein GC147_12490 [Porphyrobacter sp.]|nr:hypothetical protein [Porphyrobacter sp.]